MERLLFTGASGFLGNNIRRILEETYDVFTVGLTDDDDLKTDIAKERFSIHTLILFFTRQERLIVCLRPRKKSGFFLM